MQVGLCESNRGGTQAGRGSKGSLLLHKRIGQTAAEGEEKNPSSGRKGKLKIGKGKGLTALLAETMDSEGGKAFAECQGLPKLEKRQKRALDP